MNTKIKKSVGKGEKQRFEKHGNNTRIMAWTEQEICIYPMLILKKSMG
jgi:hypothetical protein